MTQWAWNDAWILVATSLSHKKSGATLAEIMGAADAINHAIPTAGEFSRAFSRLVECQIVEAQPGGYRLASSRLRAVRKTLEGRGGLFALVDRCLTWLQNTGLEPTDST